MTKITVRTLPATPIAVYSFAFTTEPHSATYWDIVAYYVSQFPALSDANVAGFIYIYPNITQTEGSSPVASFQAIFALPEPLSPTALEDLWAPSWAHVNETYSNITISTQVSSTIYQDLYDLFLVYQDSQDAGLDKVVGSWLLPPDVLKEDKMKDALIDFVGESGARLYMVSGKGVWDAMPRGGSDAVNPAWRKALIHAGEPFNLEKKCGD